MIRTLSRHETRIGWRRFCYKWAQIDCVARIWDYKEEDAIVKSIYYWDIYHHFYNMCDLVVFTNGKMHKGISWIPLSSYIFVLSNWLKNCRKFIEYKYQWYTSRSWELESNLYLKLCVISASLQPSLMRVEVAE